MIFRSSLGRDQHMIGAKGEFQRIAAIERNALVERQTRGHARGASALRLPIGAQAFLGPAMATGLGLEEWFPMGFQDYDFFSVLE